MMQGFVALRAIMAANRLLVNLRLSTELADFAGADAAL